jgi:citrate/tricarballylate utilization protein
MHSTEASREADRLMTICNSCRYCEGLCAVFPAMERLRSFSDGDLGYLANLCHGCGACWDDCQFAPPHEFRVNVPKTLAIVRVDSYRAYAWPAASSVLFVRNGLTVAVAATLGTAGFMVGFWIFADPERPVAAETGGFYRLMPHDAMVALFGAAFLFALTALALGVRRFWREGARRKAPLRASLSIWQAMKDAGSLRYLDGGGAGCATADAPMSDRRRLYHHFTFYGFLLCFAATAVATLYHFLLGREAPYAWYDLPVTLGTIGGIGLVIGPLGLAASGRTRAPALVDQKRQGFDLAFLAMLFLSGATGLGLLMARTSAVMEPMLALHLGIVFALFVTMPYGKFVHGLYRFVALVRYAQEDRGSAEQDEA